MDRAECLSACVEIVLGAVAHGSSHLCRIPWGLPAHDARCPRACQEKQSLLAELGSPGTLFRVGIANRCMVGSLHGTKALRWQLSSDFILTEQLAASSRFDTFLGV